ncbi:hypothetical protein Dsin_015005 [Dipteronia sinensis]|uniref:Uncharacterized protein n=1 Tax=Dipteronia sinensis TaxID=43782 RepID=A0AAE0EC45_9ROSI|nr:hypothetical protein Dsin_015005 [Dipteronia sinensis]
MCLLVIALILEFGDIFVSKMPTFLPSKRDGAARFEGSGDRQVLDLDTAVKDEVLGGVAGVVGTGAVGTGAVVGEKLDLKKMIEELDLAEIPSVFIFLTIFLSRSPLSRDQPSISYFTPFDLLSPPSPFSFSSPFFFFPSLFMA